MRDEHKLGQTLPQKAQWSLGAVPRFPTDKNPVVINYNANYKTVINYTRCRYLSSTFRAKCFTQIIPFEPH